MKMTASPTANVARNLVQRLVEVRAGWEEEEDEDEDDEDDEDCLSLTFHWEGVGCGGTSAVSE